MFKKVGAIFGVIIIILGMTLPYGETVFAKGPSKKSHTTKLQSNRKQTIVIDLPNVTKINKIKIDDGKEISRKLKGDKLTLVVDESAVDYEEWDAKYYSKKITNYGKPNVNSSKSYNYKDNKGYTGKLSKYLKSGSKRATKNVTNQPKKKYSDKGGYKGNLKRYLKSGKYTAAKSKYVSGMRYSNYNSGGYKGKLSSYLHSGSYTAAHSKYVQHSVMKPGMKPGDVAPYRYKYNSGGYSGTLTFKYRADHGEDLLVAFLMYEGTVYKPAVDTRVYRYAGNVRKPAVDTRVYKYKGTVVRPDTRVYKYKGTAYKGKWINQKYSYKIDIEYEDNHTPVVEKLTIDNDRYSEVKGYDSIEVEGEVSDKDGDKLKVSYKIANKTGVFNKSLKAGSKFKESIPIDGQIPEGYHTLEVWADDGGYLGKSKVIKKEIIVDKSAPEGVKFSGKEVTKYDLNAVIEANGDIAGLHSKAYLVERAQNKGDFELLTDWGKDNKIDEKDLESSSKFAYRAEVRDTVGHVSETGVIEFVTAPRINNGIEEREGVHYREKDPSTLAFEFDKSLDPDEGVWIEVKRSGKHIATIEQGNLFEDKNLDYEKPYDYEFISVTEDKDGNRLESEVLEKKGVTTGVSILLLKLSSPFDNIVGKHMVYRTVFSTVTEIEGEVVYNRGGTALLEYERDVSDRGNESEDMVGEQRLEAYKNNSFKLVSDYKKDKYDTKVKVTLKGDTSGMESEAELRVNEKVPKIEEFDNKHDGYGSVYYSNGY